MNLEDLTARRVHRSRAFSCTLSESSIEDDDFNADDALGAHGDQSWR